MAIRKPPDPVKVAMLRATPPISGFKRVWKGSHYEYRPKTAAELAKSTLQRPR